MEQLPNLNQEEKLKAENDFLKMKIMLEHGAEFFQAEEGSDTSPEEENSFLNYIEEYEKQFELHKLIKVYDRLEQPQQFKPANEIPDDEIEEAWQILSNYMHKFGIELGACSPKVTAKELYRFTTEELFEHEMQDIRIPGMRTNFIYDEFHPDHEYDNTKAALEDCIRPILKPGTIDWLPYFKSENIRLNNHYPLSFDDFKIIINRFKNAFDEIELINIDEVTCEIKDASCYVKGTYTVNCKLDHEETKLKGRWLVELESDEEFGFWYIINVQIEGINF